MKKNFGFLSDEFAQEKNAQMVILPVPFDLTSTYQKGADNGPAALIDASCNMELYDIETQSEVYRRGIFTAPAICANSSHEMLAKVYQEVLGFLNRKKFVATIGGEHSISAAPISAHANFHGPISVLHLDAHADLVPAYENDPFSHASVVARIKEIPQVKNVVSVGIRSMSKEEVPYCDTAATFFAHQIQGKKDWITKVSSLLTSPVYITLDLDVFDISIMAATGTPEPGGLGWYEVCELLKTVTQNHTVVGFDVVELCPIKGCKAYDFLAAKLVYKLLSYIFEGTKK